MNSRPWTDDELNRVRELYPVRATREIAVILGRSVASVYNAAYGLGLSKDVAFLQTPESGRLQKGQTRPGCIATQFQKGAAPANKGLRRPGWFAGRMRETQFRKGSRAGKAAQNWKPIGTILRDTDGYLRIKVREAVHGVEATGFGNTAVWPLLQRHVWEQSRGPIPGGHVVVFRDRNRENCAIENLECIERGELARRNGMWRRYPREMAEAIQLNGALKRKLRSLEAMKNRMQDLRNHLFETLEALKDKDAPMDLDRAKTISEVAQTLINSAKVEVDLIKAVGSGAGGEFFGTPGAVEGIGQVGRGARPRMIAGS